MADARTRRPVHTHVGAFEPIPTWVRASLARPPPPSPPAVRALLRREHVGAAISYHGNGRLRRVAITIDLRHEAELVLGTLGSGRCAFVEHHNSPSAMLREGYRDCTVRATFNSPRHDRRTTQLQHRCDATAFNAAIRTTCQARRALRRLPRASSAERRDRRTHRLRRDRVQRHHPYNHSSATRSTSAASHQHEEVGPRASRPRPSSPTRRSR